MFFGKQDTWRSSHFKKILEQIDFKLELKPCNSPSLANSSQESPGREAALQQPWLSPFTAGSHGDTEHLQACPLLQEWQL